jgi:hypothetical protein
MALGTLALGTLGRRVAAQGLASSVTGPRAPPCCVSKA